MALGERWFDSNGGNMPFLQQLYEAFQPLLTELEFIHLEQHECNDSVLFSKRIQGCIIFIRVRYVDYHGEPRFDIEASWSNISGADMSPRSRWAP